LGIAEIVDYYFDQSSGGLFGDKGLVDLVTQVCPDLIVLGNYNSRNRRRPQLEVLKAIRSKCGIPVLLMWPDSSSERAVGSASRLRGLVDFHVEWCSGTLGQHFPGDDRFLQLWVPLDFSQFRNDGGARDIPVAFIGSTLGYPGNVRAEYLDHLVSKGIPVYRAGGFWEQPISVEKYADLLRRSRISLNFSQNAPGTHQMKGRVLETMFCGALLMENENQETKKFFTPMVDYVTFTSKDDLVDKVRYYVEHDDERLRIAMNGHLKATRECNHRVFWDRIMGRLAERGLMRPANKEEA
jgi:hypothetical protein